MPYPNKYGGSCATCRKWVDAGEGSYERGTVYCAAHASGPVQKPEARPQGNPNAILVTVDKTGPSLNCDEIVFKPAGFLQGDRFDAFRNSCQGTQYGGKGDYRTVNPKLASTCAERLRSAGFTLEPNEAAKAFLNESHSQQKDELKAANERIENIDKIIKKMGKAGIYPYQREGIRWLVSRPTGAALFDDTGVGKYQPVDTPTLTPGGYRPLGKIAVGDFVIGSSGKATKVTAIFPQGVKPSYRVTFSDDSSVEAGDEHLWTVAYYRGGRDLCEFTLTTYQIRTRPVITMKWPDGKRRKETQLNLARTHLYLPMLSAPVEYDDASSLPIPAYALGQLIANGGLTDSSAVLNPATIDWVHVEGELRKDGVEIGFVHTYGSAMHVCFLGLIGKIRELGLNVLSGEKFIPEAYMHASVADRVRLFHGLMDGDGSISKEGNKVSYSTTSRKLAENVVSLIEELGGVASIGEYDRTDEGKGIEFTVRVRLPPTIRPFSLPRKLDRYSMKRYENPTRRFERVEYVRDVECVCIRVEAEDHLYATEHAILTHNTLQTLASLKDRARAVVVAPASVKGVWQKETARWRPDLRTTVLDGRGSFRWPLEGEIVITNKELLPKAVEVQEGKYKVLVPPPELAASVPSDVVLIADEAHAYKEPKAACTKNFRALSNTVRKACGKSIVLSGTPMKNRPPELWSVLQAAGLAAEAFGSYDEFKRCFHASEERYNRAGDTKTVWGMGPPEPEAIDYLKKVSLRRMKVDVISDMPAKTYEVEEVPILDKETARLCDAAMTAAEKKYGNIEAAVAHLKKSSGLGIAEMSAARAALAKTKVKRLREMVEEYEDNETPLVVFSAHRDPIDMLGARDGWAVISGDTPIPRRNQIVDDFQEGKLKGVALTIGAGGTGITLTRAFTMIMIDRMWSPADNLQAEDRIWRVGQKNAVRIIDLVANHPLDVKLYEKLQEKSDLIDASVGATSVVSKEEDLIAKIDWNKVEKEALDAAREFEKSRAKREAAASEAERERERERGEAAKRRVRKRVSAAASRRLNEELEPEDAPRRAAENAVELWAANGILALAESDPDFAKEKNDVGFNAGDNSLGHSLAMMLGWEGLTDQEWRLAVSIASHYPGQVGRRPEREASEEEIRRGIEVALGKHCEKAGKRAERAAAQGQAEPALDENEAKERVEEAKAEAKQTKKEAVKVAAVAEAAIAEVKEAQAQIDAMAAEVDPKGKLSPKKHLKILAETHPELVAVAVEGAQEAQRLAAEADAKANAHREAQERLNDARVAAEAIQTGQEDVARAKVEANEREENPMRETPKLVVQAAVLARSLDPTSSGELFVRYFDGEATLKLAGQIKAQAEALPKTPSAEERVFYAALWAMERDVFRRTKKLTGAEEAEVRSESEAEARMAMNFAKRLPEKEVPLPTAVAEAAEVPVARTDQEKKRYKARARKRMEGAPALPPGSIYAYHHGVMMPERVVEDLGEFAFTSE